MLKDKKILVAGAGGLLGASVATKLLDDGANVIAIDLDTERMKSRIDSENASPSSISFSKVDLLNQNDVKHFLTTCSDIDGAVNCSYPRNKTYGKKFSEVTLDSFNENVSMHLGSAFLLLQQCVAYFERTQRPFSFVNISSIYGVVAPNFSVYQDTHMTMPVEYAAIKSAIVHLNKYVSAYVGNSDFRVNSVSPGGIMDGQPESFVEAYRKQTNGTGMLDVKDVCGSISFLLSDAAKFITGQNIIVDDGFTL